MEEITAPVHWHTLPFEGLFHVPLQRGVNSALRSSDVGDLSPERETWRHYARVL